MLQSSSVGSRKLLKMRVFFDVSAGHEQKLDVCEQEISEEDGEEEEGEEEEVDGEREGAPTLASQESQEETSIFKLKMKRFSGATAAGLRIRVEPSLTVCSVYLWTYFSDCYVYFAPLSSLAG